MMSLGQDEPIQTYSHQCTRDFIAEIGFGGKVAANVQEFKSIVCGDIKTSLQNHLISNLQDI